MKRDDAFRQPSGAHATEAVPFRRGRRKKKQRFKKSPPMSSMASTLTQTLTNEFGDRGLFAASAIARGHVVVTFGGRAIAQSELDTLPVERRRFALQVEDGVYLYSDADGPGDWVNHSCSPNVGIVGQVVLVALRDIQPGEEICFDYAMTDISDYDSFPCSCGAVTCRGQVSGEDWRQPALQERYAGYFAPHVQRLINNIQK